jgi:uncharacterized protein YbaP (TraB family)
MKLILSAVLIFTCTFIFSQTITDKSLLWKVYGNGASDTSYLYGTIHMIEKKDFKITPQIKRTFKRANTLVMEVNLEMDDQTKKVIAKQIMFPNRKTIKDYLSLSDYQYFHSYMIDTLKIMPLKVTIYEMMTPFFLQAIILKEQMNKAVSYEEKYAKMAKKKEKLFVETMQEQLNIVAGDSLDVQADKLIKDMRAGKMNAKKEFKQMTDLYVQQDLQGLYNYIVQSMAESEENPLKSKDMLEKMLVNRNKNWIPKLENWMKTKSLFIAVGAGHLAGEEGVINLLKKEGYFVEPIFN